MTRLCKPLLCSSLTLILLIGGAEVSDAQPALNQGPMIQLEHRKFDFGDVMQESKRTHIFEVANRGTEMLVINEVETSCGCTAAVPGKDRLKPGEATEIEVTFSSGDFSGPISKFIALHTNDPAEPRVDLVIEANVIPFIEIENDRLDFGRIRKGVDSVQSTLISADAGDGFEVLSIEGADSWIDWTIVPVTQSGRSVYRLEARIKPETPFGIFNDRVVLLVKHPQRQLERIGVRGTIYSYFIPESPAVRIGSAKVGRIIQKNMAIDAAGEEGYEIVEVTSTVPYLSGTVSRVETGYILTVTLDTEKADLGEKDRLPFRQYLMLKTTDPDQDTIVIKIRGAIQS